MLDSQQLATGVTSAGGTIVATFTRLPPIPRAEMRRSLTMSQITKPAIAASATFTETGAGRGGGTFGSGGWSARVARVSATRKVILKRGDPIGVYPTQFRHREAIRRAGGADRLPVGVPNQADRPGYPRRGSLAASAGRNELGAGARLNLARPGTPSR